MSSRGGSYSWVFMVIHTKNKLVTDSLVHAEKAREIETSGRNLRGRMSVEWTSYEPMNFYPKPG